MEWARRIAGSGVMILRRLLKHPVFAVALTLLISAMAAAGFNTLALARLMLIALFLTIAFAIFTTRNVRMLMVVKASIVVASGLGCVLLDHVLHAQAAAKEEQSKQQIARSLPTPPLMLVFRPRQLFERQTLTPLAAQKVAVGYVSFPQGGYPAFTLDNESDDVMLGIQYFTIRNMSDRPRDFRFSLHIVGEGRDFTLTNDGRGRWQRRLNQNDFLATQNTGEGRLS